MQNVVTGCASLINRSCVRASLPFPAEAVLHDWWLALVAAQAGGIGYSSHPCMSYRQHGRNVVGAVGWQRQLRRRVSEALTIPWKSLAVDLMSPGLHQLHACLRRFGPEIVAIEFEQLWSSSRWLRLRAARDLGLRKHGFWRTVGFYAALVSSRPSRG